MNPRIKKDLTLECVLFYQEGGQVVMLPAEVATDRVGDLSARWHAHPGGRVDVTKHDKKIDEQRSPVNGPATCRYQRTRIDSEKPFYNNKTLVKLYFMSKYLNKFVIHNQKKWNDSEIHFITINETLFHVEIFKWICKNHQWKLNYSENHFIIIKC